MYFAKIFSTGLVASIISFSVLAAEPSQPRPVSSHPTSAANHRRVVVMVWDGMRPEFVTEQNTPALCQLARGGVTFARHHSVYLSATEVNGTALSTGAYPVHDGVMGNVEYRPETNPLKPVHTELPDVVRAGDKLTQSHYLSRATLAEIVRGAGGRTAVAGAKPVGLLADRASRAADAEDFNVYAGATLPPALLGTITSRHGPFPDSEGTTRTRNDWTTEALIDPLWANGVPEFSLLWLNQPDISQHQNGPGSPQALAGIRNADENLARVLKALEVKGVRDTTDIIVVSDHGCSTVSSRADLAGALQKAGVNAVREFKAPPARGEILVVSNSGSTMLYVIGHDQQVIRKLVDFLQGWHSTGVIFTRKAMPGTFPLKQVHLDADSAPDVLVSMHWTSDRNTNGIPGMITSDLSGYYPGQGLHVSLSPYDMHNTLIAAGPDFRQGVTNTVASGNVDIAPTVLWVLGIKPPIAMDGRVLSEALTIKGPNVIAHKPRHLETAREQNGSIWRQYLNLTEVNGVDYFDEGNGGVRVKPSN